jgi:hypothetical protein
MQPNQIETINLPASHAAQIARLLERCATHEDERAHGRVTFPLVVMTELSLEAHHWAKYLESTLAHPAKR